jgi:serine phosphatase RsbU (regulator of sigma subunit)
MDCTPLTIVSATRPFPGETVNGDAWTIHRYGNVFRLAVIDGLGHGPDAAAAAQMALTCLDEIGDVDVAAVIRACHEVLGRTRGVVMSVARVDLSAQHLQYAGVGNVEARLRQGDKEERLISYRGVVGSTMPTIRTFEFALSSNWRLIVHTDGIRARFDLAAEIDGQTIDQEWAQRFLLRWARPTDDATVVLVSLPGDANLRPAAG